MHTGIHRPASEQKFKSFKICYTLTHSAWYMKPSGTRALHSDISSPWQLNWKYSMTSNFAQTVNKIRYYDIKLCWDTRTRAGGKVRVHKKKAQQWSTWWENSCLELREPKQEHDGCINFYWTDIWYFL